MHSLLLRLLLGSLFATSFACGSDDPGGTAPIGTDPTGKAGDGGLDGGVCVAKGCDELGYKCGQTVDNCGNPLNCDVGDGLGCAAPERCGGDPDRGEHVCGCKPRANPCEAQGAQCGAIDECGTPVDCGTCGGGSLCLGNKCQCTPIADPCAGRVCGTASDGCGGSVACGPTAGQCASGSCDASGQCSCPPREQVCAGRSGPVTEAGCGYDCTPTCVPDNVAACAGADCGKARNNCGQEIDCGPLAGACAAGSACVAPVHVVDEMLPERSASFRGGYCVPLPTAKLLGKYAVRVHGFRQAGSTSINLINRAESISLVHVTYRRGTSKVQMRDLGCVATGVGDPGTPIGSATKSSLPKYRNLRPADLEVSITGDAWVRADAPHPLLGTGTPAGWVPGMPAYCVGHEGQEVALPAGDPRRGQTWLPGDRCLCPNAADANRLPGRPGQADPNNYASTPLRDCRITDEDLDGKPGYTALAKSLFIDSEVYAAGIGHGQWRGVIRDDRQHVGLTLESADKPTSVNLGCAREGGACSAPALDCGCPDRMQTVRFVPLADSAPLDCATYFPAGNDTPDQTRIDREFGGGFGSCSGATPGQCPAGSICRDNRCYTQSAKGACAKETCATGGCEPCPSGTSCRADGSCWPTVDACRPRGPLGGMCESR